jgi:hypothetical protein
VESEVNDIRPGGTNISGKNQAVPQVHEKRPVDVAQNVCRGSFAKHDLVHTRPSIALGEFELPVGL